MSYITKLDSLVFSFSFSFIVLSASERASKNLVLDLPNSDENSLLFKSYNFVLDFFSKSISSPVASALKASSILKVSCLDLFPNGVVYSFFRSPTNYGNFDSFITNNDKSFLKNGF